MGSLENILSSCSLSKNCDFHSESAEQDSLIQVWQKTGMNIRNTAHNLEICWCTNPVSIQGRVQSSVKAGESDIRFRKKSGLWFCTSFITQIIAYMHCFSHWTTAIPFLGPLQIDSADLQLSQNFFQVLIFLCTDFPHTFSKVGLCHLLSALAGSSSVFTLCLCRAQNSINRCGTKYKEEWGCDTVAK